MKKCGKLSKKGERDGEMKYVLYNLKAGGGKAQAAIDALVSSYDGAIAVDMAHIADYASFFLGLEKGADLILCGGDGTLNRFANGTRGLTIEHNLYYYPLGTGNDFARDLGYEKQAAPTFRINSYLQDLPSVTVNGSESLFLNNVGFGIDGYCTEVGDRLRAENEKNGSDKAVNYTAIAIRGLLGGFAPRNATVTVDGVEHRYQRVWLAPCMNGRFYGGGMMAAPQQDRASEARTVSVMVFHDVGKLGALKIFPSIFKGGHTKYTKHVVVLTGHDIRVEFDRPTPLQIDGETVPDVTEYAVRARVPAKV